MSDDCKLLGDKLIIMENNIKSRGLGMNVKRELYERLLFHSDVCIRTMGHESSSKAEGIYIYFLNECLRILAGVNRMDRVRNEEKRQRTEYSFTKRLMKTFVDDRTLKGRPKFGWKDGVRSALREE